MTAIYRPPQQQPVGKPAEKVMGAPTGSLSMSPGAKPPAEQQPAMPGMPPTPDLPLMSGGPPPPQTSSYPRGPSTPRGSTPAPTSGPVTTNIDMPDYQAYNPNTYHNPNLDVLSDYGQQLLDPGSDYYQQLLARMRGDIGQQGAAAKRLAALEGAESGFGAGGGAEFMQRAGDVDYATQIGMGKGAGELALAAPGMGAGMMQSTFAPQMAEYGLTEQSRQYGHGAGENARQFGVNVGLQEQMMANQMAQFNQSQQQQAQQWQDMFNLQQDELAAQYGALPDIGYGYGGYPGGVLAMG